MHLARSGHQPKIIQCPVQQICAGTSAFISLYRLRNAKTGSFLVGKEARWGFKNVLHVSRAEKIQLRWSYRREVAELAPRNMWMMTLWIWTSAAEMQEAACHGDGDEHVKRASLRHDAGAGGRGRVRVRGASVRVRGHGVVRAHGLIPGLHGGVVRGDCALGQNLRRRRRKKKHYHTRTCKWDSYARSLRGRYAPRLSYAKLFQNLIYSLKSQRDGFWDANLPHLHVTWNAYAPMSLFKHARKTTSAPAGVNNESAQKHHRELHLR